MKSLAPPGYHTVELNERVPGIEAELFRWKWQAKRRCRKLNSGRLVDTYRHEVHPQDDGRWMVIAMQNIAVKNELRMVGDEQNDDRAPAA